MDVAAELRTRVAAALPRLRAVPEAEAARERAPGKWSRKEILGHLIDSAANNHQRFVRAPLESPFVWPGYEQDRWVAVHAYATRPWTELIDLWAALNVHVAVAMAAVPADRRPNECVIGGRAGTLEWWMTDYLRHLSHHLDQILVN